jgi:hypothetical protein
MLKLDKYIDEAVKKSKKNKIEQISLSKKRYYIHKKIFNAEINYIEFSVPYIVFGFTLFNYTRRCRLYSYDSVVFECKTDVLRIWVTVEECEEESLLNFLVSDVPMGDLE